MSPDFRHCTCPGMPGLAVLNQPALDAVILCGEEEAEKNCDHTGVRGCGGGRERLSI